MDSDIFRDDIYADSHVLVTGGSSGVNFGIAERFAEKGAALSLLARDRSKLDTACENLKSTYDIEAIGVSSDVRDYDQMKTRIEESVDRFGTIDVLVCGAAGNFPAEASDMSANAFKSVIDIDLLGTFNACRATYEYLTKPGAAIIAISAPQSEQPYPLQSHVCAAKAGVDALVKTLAVEWSDDGIRANAIQPGPVTNTEGMDRLTPTDETKEQLADVLPSGRFIEKKEIGDMALYLASSAASGITGAIVPVDGGQLLIGSGKLIDSLL